MPKPYMTDSEARETIQDLHDTAVRDTVNMGLRLVELRNDYEADPWELTAKQIERIETRLVIRRLQAEALAIALEKF